jgi:hypothetical protein
MKKVEAGVAILDEGSTRWNSFWNYAELGLSVILDPELLQAQDHDSIPISWLIH